MGCVSSKDGRRHNQNTIERKNFKKGSKGSVTFEIRVPIKDKLRSKLIFNLNSKLPIALILAFLGYSY